MKIFEKNLKQFRKDNNLTQKQLGELAGCSESNISYLESGKITPTFELIKAIHEIDPDIDLKEFLFGGDKSESKGN